MKLLIVTQKLDTRDDNLGFFHRWIEEFAKKCEFVTVICLFEGVHTLPSNVHVYSLGKEEGISRMKYIRRFYSYIWKEREQYDAVLVHMNQIYVLLGAVLWRALGKKVGLWYAHGKTSISLRVAAFLAHDIFTSTPESFRIPTSKSHILGHGIDVGLFRHVERKKHTEVAILSYGRISPVKDYETLIDAVAILREWGVGCKVSIVGSPGTPQQQRYLEQLQDRIRAKNLEYVISFKGPVTHKELPSVLEHHDVFLHTSRTGSLDKAPLEAMATGLPVYTCNESVIRILPDSLAGTFNFASGDSRELAHKIQIFSQFSQEQIAVFSDSFSTVAMQHRLDAFIGEVVSLLGRS